jgi:hypothetical protein
MYAMALAAPQLWAQSQWSNGSSGAIYYNGGNVSVGTSSTGSKLHIFTSTNADGLSIDGPTNPAINFRNSGTVGGYLGLATQSTAYFTDAIANDLAIRSESGRILFGKCCGAATLAIAGNYVGIGSTYPSYLLDVNGTAADGVRFMINENSTSPHHRRQLQLDHVEKFCECLPRLAGIPEWIERRCAEGCYEQFGHPRRAAPRCGRWRGVHQHHHAVRQRGGQARGEREHPRQCGDRGHLSGSGGVGPRIGRDGPGYGRRHR